MDIPSEMFDKEEGSVRPIVPKIPLELCSTREGVSGTRACMSDQW